MVDINIVGRHDLQPGSAPVYTGRLQGAGYSPGNYRVVGTVAEVRAQVVAQSDHIRIPNRGEWSWNAASTATDDGTEATAAIAITGVTTGRYLPSAGSTLSVPLPDGTTAAAHTVTNRAKHALSSGVVSIDPRATPIPNAADVAAGFASLRASELWGSSLAATKSTVGKTWTAAELIAFTGGANAFECTVTAGIAEDGGNTGVLMVPSTTSPAPANFYMLLNVPNAAAGQRHRLEFWWKANAQVTGQASNVSVYTYTTSGLRQLILYGDGQVITPGNAPDTGYSVRQWARADGWKQVCIEWVMGTTFNVYLLAIAGDTFSFVGDGATGIYFDRVRVTEVTATAVTNLSTASAATITRVSASAPWVENSRCPGDGWWPNGSQVLRFNSLGARTLLLGAAAYQGVSGTAHPLSLTWEWAPYQAPLADGDIWRFAGSTAAFAVQHTDDNHIAVTRTTDAGVTTSIEFTTVIGHVPQVLSVVCDGTNALLYRQGALVESLAFALTGATTFTSGSFGGAISARVAEFALHASALSAEAVRQVHVALAAYRSWRTDPIPVWLMIGQSNAAPNGKGTSLAKFGSPAQNMPSLHFETWTVSGWTSTNSGWGPSRLFTHRHECDARADGGSTAAPFLYNNSPDINAQGYFGAEVGFAERAGYVATARFAVAGASITTYLSSGVNFSAMRAAFDNAFASIGLPCYMAGVIVEGGEADAITLDLAQAFASNVQTLVAQLSEFYNANSPRIVVYRLHRRMDLSNVYSYAAMVRQQCDYLDSSLVTVATANVDDLPMATDNLHLSAGTTQFELGRRLADAARSIGA